MANPHLAEAGIHTRITADNARDMQERGAEKKRTKRYFIKLCGKAFDKRAKEAFKVMSDKAADGDVAALEQIRKWLFGEEDEKQMSGNNIVIQVGKDEAVALDKWSKND